MNKSFKEQEKVEKGERKVHNTLIQNVMSRSNSKKKKSPRKTDVIFS
jgi:hypothetical protein